MTLYQRYVIKMDYCLSLSFLKYASHIIEHSGNGGGGDGGGEYVYLEDGVSSEK